MLKVEYFYYMIEIAKTGTINRAAENLYISQPYLSLSLKEIESILEVKLFNRTNRGVTLTEAGKKFLDYSNQIVALINQSNNLKKQFAVSRQKLKITSMPSFTIVDLFYRFSAEEKYAQCDILYEEHPNPLIVDKVLHGEADIGMFYTTSKEYAAMRRDLTNKGLNFAPLVEEPLCAIVSSKNPLARQEAVTLADLEAYTLIVESIKLPNKSNPVENNPFPELFKGKQVGSLKFNNNRSMLYYLTKSADSFCVGQRSLNLSNPFVQSNMLKYIPISDLTVTLTTGYITSEHAQSSQLEESFIDFIEGFFKQYNQDGSFDLVL